MYAIVERESVKKFDVEAATIEALGQSLASPCTA